MKDTPDNPAKPRRPIGEYSAWLRWLSELGTWFRWLPVLIVGVLYLYLLLFAFQVMSWGTCYDDGLAATSHLMYRPIASIAIAMTTVFLLLISVAVIWWGNRRGGGILLIVGLIILVIIWRIPRTDLKTELTQFAEGFRDRIQNGVDFHSIQKWIVEQKYKPGDVIPKADWPPAFDKVDKDHLVDVKTDPRHDHTLIIHWHQGFQSWFLIIGPSDVPTGQIKSPIDVRKEIQPGVYVDAQVGG